MNTLHYGYVALSKNQLRNAKIITEHWILVRRNVIPRGTCSQFIVILKPLVQYFS